jgi:hypothetical protein
MKGDKLTENKALAIRTCTATMESYNGFKWPSEIGATVACKDWYPKPVCGGGLHGLIDGIGNYGLLSNSHDAVWQIVEVERDKCVSIDNDKVKFPSCKIVYSGNMAGALTRISQEWIRIALSDANGSVTKDDRANAATTGYRANAATTGNGANAATTGNYANAATTGYRANAATTGNGANAATTGEGANAATTGEGANAATTGEKTIAASLGYSGTAKAGKDGALVLTYWDEKKERPRVLVAYVGEKGIKVDTEYRLNDKHEFEVVK